MRTRKAHEVFVAALREGMTLDEYQYEASKTDVGDGPGHPLAYYVLGLAGETGEVAEKIKKTIRDDGGVISDERLEGLKGELGDVLWYWASLARRLGLSAEEIAQGNLDKLASRKERGMLKGDGDNR